MRSFLYLITAVSGVLLAATSIAQSNPTARALPFTEAFPAGTFSAYPSGFQGWSGVSGAATTTQALAEASAPNANASLTAAAPASGGSGGLFGSAGRVAVNTSSNATNGVNQLMMAINANERMNVTVDYSVYSVIANPRTIGVVCQYRVGTSGTWTTISPSSGSNPYSQTGAVGTGLKTTVSATLPPDCNYQPVVQVRWAIWRGTETGNSSALGFDDISAGGTLDTDEDGDPDSTDPCPLLPNLAPGYGCDDGNPNTIGDVVSGTCVCEGTVANDDCANSTYLGGAQAFGTCPAGATTGSTSGASASGGSCAASAADVWYYFSASTGSSSFIDLVPGTAAGMGIEVFVWDACVNATSVYCSSGNSHTVPTVTGQTYAVRVYTNTPGDFSICASAVQTNDDCANSSYIGATLPFGSCPAGAYAGSTLGATPSGGSCGASSNDVWYYFSASNGSYSFVDLAPGTASGMGIEVFVWDACVNATSVYCAAGNSHTVPTVAGQTYAVRVYSTTPGDFTICLSAPQPNDDCATSTYIGGSLSFGSCPAGAYAGSTLGATPSGGSCGASSNDVWYYFSASSGSYSFVDLAPGAASGMGIEVFDWDACVNATSVYCAAGNSHTVPTVAGQTYAVRVYSTTPGDFTICVSAPQPNDDCASATNIGNYDPADCPANATSGSTLGATPSGGSCGASSNDVWYYFYSGSSLFSNISLTAGTAAGLGIEVFETSCGGTTIYCALGTSHAVPVIPAQYYYMRVFSTTAGDFSVCVSNIVQPGNDDCAGSTYLGGAQSYGSCTSTAGTTIGASASGGGCSASANDVWYYVYASSSANTYVDLLPGTAGGMGIEVFLYDGCVSSTSIYCASGNSHTVAMTPNVLHTIRVFTVSPGTFSICVSAPPANDDCANASGLGLYNFGDCPVNATAGTTVGATQSGMNGCAGGATQDVWYQAYSAGGTSLFVDLSGVTAGGIGIEVFDACGGSAVYCASGANHTVPTTVSTYYYIKVFSTTPGEFAICTSTPVVNNECDYATGLGTQAYADCPVNATAGTTVGATQSGPNSCSAGATQDVWYQAYSYYGSSLFVDLSGVTATGIGIEVFDGCGGNLVYCASGTSHTVPTALTTTYYIKVFSTSPGAFNICTSTPVANNECDYATSLGTQAYADCPANATAGTTVGATQSGPNSCSAGATQDVWYYAYSYSGSSLFVDLSGVTATGIGIEVFDGCGGNLVYCATGTSHTVPTALSAYYYVKVFSTSAGAFNICTSTPVANNECAYATSLGTFNNGECPTNSTSGTTVGSTQSGANGCNGTAAYDVWYYFYAGNAASVVVNLAETGATGIGVEVFDGCPGTQVYCATGTTHTVAVIPNLYYYAKVFSSTAGGFNICVNYPPPVYDCLGVLGGSALPGTACNDNNACTTGDTWNVSCQCIATPLPDGDGDGVCDAQDDCPTVIGQIGSGCDDGNPCTTGDALNGSCVCAGGSTPDSDGDGTCDGLDPCPYLANLNNGDPCDDGNASTTGDVVAGCTCSGVVSTGGLALAPGWAQVNGTVETLAHDALNDILYIGGQFTRVGGPVEPYGAKVNITDGTADLSFPNPNGPVFAAAADGAGGWYIGGDFTTIGGVGRNRAARINADGSLHAWNPNASGGPVSAILVSGSTVYLGGSFTSIGGQPRNMLAAVNSSTGVPSSWNPGVTGSFVGSFALSGSTLYVGGFFSALGGQSRNHIGAVSTISGAATTWNPSPDGYGINTILVNGSTVFVGGFFDNIGGQPRRALAALNNSTGAATAWNASVDAGGLVYELAVNGANLVVAGGFDQIGGQSRRNIAQVSLTTGTATSWISNLYGGMVLDMFVNGSSAYFVGYFTAVQGQSRHYAAKVDLSTSALSSWDPAPGPDLVHVVCQSGSEVFVGGRFTTLGGLQRNCLAALDGTTGQPLAWNPGVTHPAAPVVWDMDLSGDSLVYVGGQFTTVGGAPRSFLAAVRTSNGTATSWAPNANNIVSAVHRSGNSVYASGAFTTIGGQTRNSIACLNSTTGLATSWNPGMSGGASDLLSKGDTLFVGGYFSLIGGVSRSNLAALSRSTGTTLGWTANTDDEVKDLDLVGDLLYVAGSYTTIGGQARAKLSVLDRVSGAVSPWAPSPNGPYVQLAAVAADPSGVYLGGFFSDVNGLGRPNLASVSTFSGATSGWTPGPNSDVHDMKISGGRLFVGGDFGFMGGQPRSGIAMFLLPVAVESTINARAHLEGPYNSTTGLMGDAIRSAGLVPVSEPYTGLGYSHAGGGGSEFTTPTVLATTGNNAIVDWILLELRDNANSSSIVATRAALVQRDGDIVDVDGVSPVTFQVAPGNYFVAVRHRNHLGCMTLSTVALSGSPITVDYTTLATTTYGTNARKTSGGAVSKQLLWAGDVTFNGQVKYTGSANDRDPILVTVGSTTPNNVVSNTYSTRDVNMNGEVKYTGTGNDRDPILVNVGSTTPNNIRVQQLP